MDWFDLDHWQAVLATIVAIGTPIVAILGWFKPLLRWFRTLFKRKVQPKGILLSFVPNDQRCLWSVQDGELSENLSLVFRMMRRDVYEASCIIA